MNLKELADIAGKSVNIYGTIKDDNTLIFTASISDIEIKDGPCLISQWGKGKTPEQALQDYAFNIKGETAVSNAFQNDRREFKIPTSLTAF